MGRLALVEDDCRDGGCTEGQTRMGDLCLCGDELALLDRGCSAQFCQVVAAPRVLKFGFFDFEIESQKVTNEKNPKSDEQAFA